MRIGAVRKICDTEARVHPILEDERGNLLFSGKHDYLLSGDRVRRLRLRGFPVALVDGRAVVVTERLTPGWLKPLRQAIRMPGGRSIPIPSGLYVTQHDAATRTLHVLSPGELRCVRLDSGRVERIVRGLPKRDVEYPWHDQMIVQDQVVSLFHVGLTVIAADGGRCDYHRHISGPATFLPDGGVLAVDPKRGLLLRSGPESTLATVGRVPRLPRFHSYHLQRVGDRITLSWHARDSTWCATVENGGLEQRTRIHTRGGGYEYTAIPEHDLLAIGTFSGQVALWNVRTGSVRWVRPKDWCTIYTLHWSSRRSTLFIGRKDGVVQSVSIT